MVKRVKLYRWTNESNRSADGQLEDWPIGRNKAIIMKVRQKESTVEACQSTIGNGSRVNFREF
jgi:hypothetical protein